MLRQRLAEMDVRAMHCSYPNYPKQHRPTVLPCSNIAPFVSPDDRPLPLPEKKDKQQPKNNTNTQMMTSAMNNSSNIPTTDNADKPAEQGAIVFNKQPSKPINLNRSNSQNNSNDNSTRNNTNKPTDPLIGVDLLADNHYGVNIASDPILKGNDDNNDFAAEFSDLNNVDDRLGGNIMNNRNHSTSPVLPAVRTKARFASNMQMLKDKWQVSVPHLTFLCKINVYLCVCRNYVIHISYLSS